MSLDVLRALEKVIAKEIPAFRVEFKDESRLMRVLATLMCPFNPTFLTNFTTTWGETVYFPSRVEYEARSEASAATLAHEFVHMSDRRQAGLRFLLSYGAPQIWALPLLLLFAIVGSVWPLCILLAGYGALTASIGKNVPIFSGLLAGVVAAALIVAWVKAGIWTLLLVGGLACFAPWPSPGRTHWEARGYAMDIAIYMWIRDALVPEDVIRDYVGYFTGPDYYFMCRDRGKVEALFAASIRATLERKLQREPPYSVIHAFLVEQGRVAPDFRE